MAAVYTSTEIYFSFFWSEAAKFSRLLGVAFALEPIVSHLNTGF